MSPFKEASVIKSFIVRGFTNDKWANLHNITSNLHCKKHGTKARHRYQEPLIVMKS